MNVENGIEDHLHRFETQYQRLAAERQSRPAAVVLARFQEIDGGSLAGVVSVQLFTTVIPLIILGFSYLSGFAENISPGVLITRELGLVRPLSDWVRDAFGSSAGLSGNWTFIGLAGFLVWGIPMSNTIAGIWAKAWRREPFEWREGFARGVVWFALYLAMLGLREGIAFGGDFSGPTRAAMFLVALIPVWIFWSLTPLLLVRDGGKGAKYLALAGLAGALIDGTVIPLAARVIFPAILRGWEGFGPMGVAMALMTWAGVIGVGWVLTACISAVLWSRTAPTETVVESETVG